MKVLRHGKEKTFSVTLKEMPEQKVAGGSREPAEKESDALNGVEVGDIDTCGPSSSLSSLTSVKGALITNVDPNSGVGRSPMGLRAGQVIQEVVNRKPITNADEAVEASKHVKNKRTLLRLWSHGGSRYTS